jgi:putative radical SAM enzyme (TIGR03279 family)
MTGGLVAAVAPGSLAESLGVRPGDRALEVNGEPVSDVIDVQDYAAAPTVALEIEREGRRFLLRGERAEGQPLGLEFDHPTFDTDIRRCNNLCEFCFVVQMAPGMRRTLYIKDDDYRYSFLFGHYVTLTNLTDHDRWRIANQFLSPLYVSVHATDNALRRRILRNPDAPDIVEELAWLAGEGIEVHTQIVVTPGLNDGAYLAQSVRDLATLYPGVRSVSVAPVGLTRHHKSGLRLNTRAEAEAILDACDGWRTAFRADFGVNFVYPTDEWLLVAGRPIPPVEAYDGLELQENGLGCVRGFLDDWKAIRPKIERLARRQQPAYRSVTLVTGSLFAPTLAACAGELAERLDIPINVIPIRNDRLGETVTVAGLLMAGDVTAQLLAQADSLGEAIVLPRVMFDHPDGISLDDRPPVEVSQALGKPVALADTMSDVATLLLHQATP